MTTPSADLIQRYNQPGPRYTSYPTAPYWTPAFTAADYATALGDLGRGGAGTPSEISLYVHLPFCERRCTFCACNVIISREHERAGGYIDQLTREMDLALAAAGHRPSVVQLHWGGGTPTWLSARELDLLMDRIAERFDLRPDREQSVEVHPVVTTPEQVDVLVARGLNRLSMGIQDFNPDVQRVIHRDQTYEQTRRLIDHARARGIAGINADLIYGLPLQTVAGFDDTLRKAIELGVDRVALYNFAFLPDRVPTQKAIDPTHLPPADIRLELFLLALRRFAEAGYRQIGLDHFAKPGDELARAQDDRTLQRNFMGYTTRAGRDLLSFGVSAISRVGRAFVQNVKGLEEYAAALDAGRLPVERGLRLSDNDLLREQIIQQLMCFGRVDVAALCHAAGQAALLGDPDLAGKLAPLAADGLIAWDGATLTVTPLGRYFLRNIAMAFDAYLAKTAEPVKVRGKMVAVKFSQTV